VQLAAPEDLIGVSVHYVAKEGWGGYGSLWLSTTNLAEEAFYYETLQPDDIERLGGTRIGEDEQWGGGRFGLTRRLGRQLYAYGGVGLMRSRRYVEYEYVPPLAAPDRTLWVDDVPRDGMKGVLEIGLVFYTEGGIAFSIGAGTHPVGFAFGMGFGSRL
jgi:hypothetical protein